jgi:hypothetical protein
MANKLQPVLHRHIYTITKRKIGKIKYKKIKTVSV